MEKGQAEEAGGIGMGSLGSDELRLCEEEDGEESLKKLGGDIARMEQEDRIRPLDGVMQDN
jgi:hypothetical protein